MKTQHILLLFFVLWVSVQQTFTIHPSPGIVYPAFTNPKFSRYWYAVDCCPKISIPQNIQELRNRTGLIRNYNFFKYRWCRCTHYVFGVDYSGSMSAEMPTAHGVLTTMASFLDSANQGSPFIYFFSYFYFNHIAEIPEYLHIKPFTPLPPHPPATGGTSFNHAIERGV